MVHKRDDELSGSPHPRFPHCAVHSVISYLQGTQVIHNAVAKNSARTLRNTRYSHG